MTKLALVVPYFNFCQYASRKRNYDRFMAHMAAFPVRVITVECAIGSQDFQVTRAGQPDHLQVRAEHPLWFKENLINLGCRYAVQTQPDVTAFGWIDADLEFQNTHWVQASLDTLKSYPIMQPFESLVYLDKHNEPQMFPSVSYAAWLSKEGMDPRPGQGTVPGGAWIVRHDIFEQLGGLLECHIVGGCDHYTARALIGEFQSHGIFTSNGKHLLKDWMKHADHVIQKKIGYIKGTVFHHYHGEIKNRQYSTREISSLSKFDYDPTQDLIRNADGVIQLAGNKPAMQAAITAYFRSRAEDV